MTLFSLRKVAVAGLGAALVGASLTVGLGAGVAAAVPTCEKTASDTGGNVTAQYRITQEAMGDGTVPPGGEIVYQTRVSSISGVPALIKAIGQFHPAGFTPVSARVNVSKVIGGQGWTDETLVEDAGQDFTQVKGGGWNITGGKTATLEVTYKVPESAKVGDELRSGMAFDRSSLSGPLVFKDTGACVTIRAKNPVEAGAGSLDAAGLGSVNTGSGNIFGSATDPAGSVGDMINGINIGKIFGDLLKSAS